MTATTVTAATNAGEPSPKMAKMETVPVLRVKKLSENAILPVRGSTGAAGYDLARYVTRGAEFKKRSRFQPLFPPSLASCSHSCTLHRLKC
jgi:hypothetical protein